MQEVANLRAYPARWNGEALLVCRKCQKKLKGGKTAVAKLKKSLRKVSKKDPFAIRFHVIPVPCMKLCPGAGITVCTRAGLLDDPPQLTILRTRQDITALCGQGNALARQAGAG